MDPLLARRVNVPSHSIRAGRALLRHPLPVVEQDRDVVGVSVRHDEVGEAIAVEVSCRDRDGPDPGEIADGRGLERAVAFAQKDPHPASEHHRQVSPFQSATATDLGVDSASKLRGARKSGWARGALSASTASAVSAMLAE